MFSICFAILFVLAHFPLTLTYIQFQAHVKSSNWGLAGARCPSSPLPFHSEFLSQFPLSSVFVPMFFTGSIHQNVLTCPKSVYSIKLVSSVSVSLLRQECRIYTPQQNRLEFPRLSVPAAPSDIGNNGC